MNYETVRAEDFSKKVKLVGVTIVPKVINTGIEGVVLTDSQGNTVILEKRGYSDFTIMIPKRETTKKYRVNAKFPLFGEVTKDFDNEIAAINAKNELKDLGAENADWNSVEVELGEK